MFEAVVKAALLGLSTGAVCLGYCAPVLLPLMVGDEKGSWRARFSVFLEFLAGRFLAYLAFGLAAGWAGSRLKGGLPGWAVGVAFLGLGLLLVLFGLVREFPHLGLCRIAAGPFQAAHPPFVMGAFMGFNLCPPFVAAFADVFAAGRMLYGLTFFLVLFVVTSIFLVPYVFLGRLSSVPVLRTVARLASLIVGVIYLVMGAAALAV